MLGDPSLEGIEVGARRHGFVERPLAKTLATTLDKVQGREELSDEPPPDATEARGLIVFDGFDGRVKVLDHGFPHGFPTKPS